MVQSATPIGARMSAPAGVSFDVRGVSKRFVTRERDLLVLDHVDLTVQAGEFVSIVGPSGCGKSTLLNMIAGLEQPSSGEIVISGRSAPDRLGSAAYMHQKDLLLPWRTVLGNAILALEIAGVPKPVGHARAEALLDRFGLKGFESAYPATLSGGMRQRAAFLRTVLSDRPLLLLDEPFGALDALTRSMMQEWLLSVWDDLGRTVLFVTHDVEEAIFLSDRVLVMSARPGRLVHERAVDLPRPRHFDVIATPEFASLKADLFHALREAGPRQLQ